MPCDFGTMAKMRQTRYSLLVIDSLCVPHRGVRLPTFPFLDAAGSQPVPQGLSGFASPALYTLLGLYVSVSGMLPEGVVCPDMIFGGISPCYPFAYLKMAFERN